MSLINIIKEKNMLHGNGVNVDAINDAEKALGMKFSDEYKEYLLEFGLVAYAGHEWTGLGGDKCTDVVTVTKMLGDDIGITDKYVIEDTGIDGIVIWQNSIGKVYRTDYDGNPREIYDSLEEYICG